MQPSQSLCRYCKTKVNAEAVVCPNCQHALGDFKSQIAVFFKAKFLYFSLTALVGGAIGFYFSAWLPHVVIESQPQLSCPAKPKVNSKLTYASDIQKIGYVSKIYKWGKSADLYSARIALSNYDKEKVTNVKIMAVFSENIRSHSIISPHPIRDSENKLISDKSLDGKRDVELIIPYLLPGEGALTVFEFKGEDVRILDLSISSSEGEGIRTEFACSIKNKKFFIKE